MKKVLSVVLAVMMLASLSVFAFADVNPSVTTKAAPSFEEDAVTTDGTAVKVELTSAANAEGEVKEAIDAAVEAVSSEDGLADALAAAGVELDAGTKTSVSDVFFFDAKDANGESVFKEDGSVKVKVKVELPKNLMKVMQLVGDVWVEVPVVIDENGEPVLELSYAGPIVFVTNANVENG